VAGLLSRKAWPTALAVHLLRTQGITKAGARRHTKGRPRARLRLAARSSSFIASISGKTIALADLAARRPSSAPHHFGEAFKTRDRARPALTASSWTGEVERGTARLLPRTVSVRSPRSPMLLGFSSQAHLTTNFRRLTGHHARPLPADRSLDPGHSRLDQCPRRWR